MTPTLTYGPWGETLAEQAAAARSAEDAGAQVVWVPELHRSATVSAAALAAGTTSAKVGTAVALAFTRSPMVTALEALDLDEISGGRFVLGLGPGVRRLNEDWHNAAVGSPAKHLRESVDCIRTFWRTCTSGDPIEVDGEYEHLRIRGYQRPFAVLRTDIPIYLGAMGPIMTALAGEIGDGFLSHELCSPQWLTGHITPDLNRGLRRAGRDRTSIDVVVSACCSIDSDPERARRRAAGLVAFYASVRSYSDFFAFHDLTADHLAAVEALRSGRGADDLADAVSDAAVDALTLTGDRDTVAAKLAGYDGLADTVKITPPTHGVSATETRVAQQEIIAMIAEITGGRG